LLRQAGYFTAKMAIFMPLPSIHVGELYWIELEGVRIKVRAVEVCPFLAGWWNCTSERSGVELMVPETAFREVAHDGKPPQAGTIP
jgi:hypothetical protein